MTVKRPLALLGAVIVLVLAWLGSRAVESNRARTVKREAARGAETPVEVDTSVEPQTASHSTSHPPHIS